jgi:hypothetical protein
MRTVEFRLILLTREVLWWHHGRKRVWTFAAGLILQQIIRLVFKAHSQSQKHIVTENRCLNLIFQPATSDVSKTLWKLGRGVKYRREGIQPFCFVYLNYGSWDRGCFVCENDSLEKNISGQATLQSNLSVSKLLLS